MNGIQYDMNGSIISYKDAYTAKFYDYEWESFNGGHDWIRTNDHYHVKVVLYQLSYATKAK